MAFSNTIIPPSFPLPPANKPKALSFTFPHADKWKLYSTSRDSNNTYFMQWCQKGTSLAESEHRIIFESRVIHDMNFTTFCKKRIDQINLVSNREHIFLEPFIEDRFLKMWVKKSGLKLTYLFTLLVGIPPYFFRLEYETKDQTDYNSQSIYLEMLRNVQIIDYHPSQF